MSLMISQITTQTTIFGDCNPCLGCTQGHLPNWPRSEGNLMLLIKRDRPQI